MNAPLDIRRVCDDVRSRFPLSAVAGQSMKLHRSGRELVARCPFHEDRSPSFTIFAGDRRFHCFGCGADGDVLDFVRRAMGCGLIAAIQMLDGGALPVIAPVPVADAADRNERREEALAIWRAAAPATGTPVESYLRSRGILTRIPDSLRFARLRYGARGPEHPVMVALVAGADDLPTGIQRTYLNVGGTGKAAVAKPKLSLGQVRGGAVRLAPCSAELVVCEGIEDGLTLQQELGLATWVAAGAGMMPAMRFPAGVRSVVIGADGDAAGEAAAQRAAATFASAHRRVRIIRPIDAKDFNAELMERVQ